MDPVVMNPVMTNLSSRLQMIGASVFACALAGTPALAQTPPPIGGVSGTIAPEGSGDQVEAGANAVVSKTAEGTRWLFRAFRGNSGTPINDFLSGLRPGTNIVLHYSATGAQGASPNGEAERVREGMVLQINRTKQEISVRLDDKSVDTLQLAEPVIRDNAPHGNNSVAPQVVVVDYTDDAGRKQSHSFKQKPDR